MHVVIHGVLPPPPALGNLPTTFVKVSLLMVKRTITVLLACVPPLAVFQILKTQIFFQKIQNLEHSLQGSVCVAPVCLSSLVPPRNPTLGRCTALTSSSHTSFSLLPEVPAPVPHRINFGSLSPGYLLRPHRGTETKRTISYTFLLHSFPVHSLSEQ
jgi:hypothetical protein